MTAFTIEQRTKEIGVRKILGASGLQIVTLLFKHTFIIMAIAAIVASLLSYGIMREWLEGYHYKNSINISAFIWAALASFVIAFITMSTQSYNTTKVNPVKALRHE